ncbi:glycosyltransferase [Liquorilactobacillus mali]
MQYGFSNYIPTYCERSKFVEYKKMIELIKNAHIVITHGGPASFIMAINEHKVPIVVPRMFSFGEHINNHQVDFVKKVAGNKKNIIPVYNIDNIEDIIENYDKKMDSFESNINFKNNQKKFIEGFEKVIADLIK